jgi:hypothetical protein
MMRDANPKIAFANLSENAAIKTASAQGFYKPGGGIFGGQNAQEFCGLLQANGAKTIILQSDTITHYQSQLSAGRQLSASVGNGFGFFHRVRIEGMTPDGLFSIGDPNTGRSYLVNAMDFMRQVNPGRTVAVHW